MRFLDTKHKVKSAVITGTLLVVMLLLMFNYGMKYNDPPIEYGVAINFGNSDVGSGEPVEESKEGPSSESEEKEPVLEEVADEVKEEIIEEEPIEDVVEEDVVEEEVIEEVPTEEVVSEKVITNDSSKEVPKVVEKEKEPIKKPKEKIVKKIVVKDKPKKKPVTEKKPIKKLTPKKAVPKKEVVSKPKVSKKTKSLLDGLIGNSNKGANRGEGDGTKPGVKGKSNGKAKSSKYYGNQGGGSGGNYQLSGRTALSKPKYNPDCEKEGTVVVEIDVDRSGKVVVAKPCAKGTTNTAACLCNAAKRAALATKWNTDTNAKPNQRGRIIYRFSLSR